MSLPDLPVSGIHSAAPVPSAAGAPRVALVTGAARRIGRGIALGLAREGWDVAVHYHASAAAAQQVVDEIVALGRRAVALQADLASEADTARLLPDCTRLLGVPVCVVNNASLFEPDTARSFGYAGLERMMRVNLAAPLALARDLCAALAPAPSTTAASSAAAHGAATAPGAAVPPVPPVAPVPGRAEANGPADPAGARGVVINLLDQKLFNLNPDYLSYTLSKAALQTATATLAQALAPTLRVVGVAPGLTLRSAEQTDASFAEAHRHTPLGRASDLDDIVSAVCFLARAKAITGTTLVVDGGQHLLPLPRDVMFLT